MFHKRAFVPVAHSSLATLRLALVIVLNPAACVQQQILGAIWYGPLSASLMCSSSLQIDENVGTEVVESSVTFEEVSPSEDPNLLGHLQKSLRGFYSF